MTQPVFKKISIIGVGLMGGSLGLAIKDKNLSGKVVGFFRSKEKLRWALDNGFVDEGTLDFNDAVRDSDLIILCSPVGDIIAKLGSIRKICGPKVLVTDTGSTKSEIVKAAAGLNFIGSHPLAGSEHSGMHHARKDLFNNAVCILTPPAKRTSSSVKILGDFWKKIGARIFMMTPRAHDHFLAFSSHLPHLAAFSLMRSIPLSSIQFSAGGLRDTTRIALSSPELWADIFFSNKNELLKAVSAYKKELVRLENFLKQGHKKNVLSFLKASQKKRLMLVSKT